MEEIKAQDLMIGCIVTVDNPQYHPKLKGVPLRVTGIQERSIQGEIEHCVNLEHVNQKPNTYYETYSQFMKFIRPIPLTEDVLLKAGFRKSNNQFFHEYYRKIDNIPLTIMKTVKGKFFFIPSIHIVWSVELSSLHELQNIIKCLTKTELIVEL